jgi:hypothetical protein
MVAVADGEARVVEAGTYGNTNYERLLSGKEKNKNKLYYYSAFEQYVESDDGIVQVIDPEIEITKSASEKKSLLMERKNALRNARSSGKLSFEKNATMTPMAI